MSCKYSDGLRPFCRSYFSGTGFLSCPHSQALSARSQGSFPWSCLGIWNRLLLVQILDSTYGRVFLGSPLVLSSKLCCLPSAARPSKLQINVQDQQTPLGKWVSQCISFSPTSASWFSFSYSNLRLLKQHPLYPVLNLFLARGLGWIARWPYSQWRNGVSLYSVT